MGLGRGVPLSIWILILTFTCAQKNAHATSEEQLTQDSHDYEYDFSQQDEEDSANEEQLTQHLNGSEPQTFVHHDDEMDATRNGQFTQHSDDPKQNSAAHHDDQAHASEGQHTQHSDDTEQNSVHHDDKAHATSEEQVTQHSDDTEQNSVVQHDEKAHATSEEQQSDDSEQNSAVQHDEKAHTSDEQHTQHSDDTEQNSVHHDDQADATSEEQVTQQSDDTEQNSVVQHDEKAHTASEEQHTQHSNDTEQNSVHHEDQAHATSEEQATQDSDDSEQNSVVQHDEKALTASKEQHTQHSNDTEQNSVHPDDKADATSEEQVTQHSDDTEQNSVVQHDEKAHAASKEQHTQHSNDTEQNSVHPDDKANTTSEMQITENSNDPKHHSVVQHDHKSHTTAHNDQVCSTWGYFHHKTFDGKVYHFPGTCNYLFASNCKSLYEEFNIQIQRSMENDIPTFTHITLKLENEFVKLAGGEVTVNGHVVELPYNNHGLRIDRNGLYLTLFAKIGIYLKWNEEDALMIELDAKYTEKICGLCGDFNDLPDNEFNLNAWDWNGFSSNIVSISQESDGRAYSLKKDTMLPRMEMTPIQYGNLQKVKSPTEQCEDVTVEPLNNCTDHANMCASKMTGHSFLACNRAIDVRPYIKACEQDVCHSNNELLSFSLCTTFTEYSRQCSHSENKPLNWRSEDLCPITCPFNMLYEECGMPCVDTCSNTEQSDLCEDQCTDGCYCPEGTVYDDYNNTGCIKQAECPCTFNGKIYARGTGYKTACHDCTCTGGSWDCKSLPCVGTCSVEGGSHITTFDETNYNFHGDCTYVIAKDCSNKTFSVMAELRMCGKSESETCLKSVTVSHNGGDKTFFIKPDGTVLMDMVYAHLPITLDTISVFEPSTHYIIVATSYGLQLEIELKPLMQLRVRLEPHLEGTVCGLCGSFNKNPADDFMTLNGVVEGTGASFANTWKTQSDCPNVKNIHEDPCAASVENEKYAEHWCEMMSDPDGPFTECHAILDPSNFEKNCMYDTCKCQKTEDCMCASVVAYVRACAARGVFMKGWRSEICDKYISECHSSQVYTYSADKCQATCHSLIEADPTCNVKFLPVDGCVCPDGFYLDEDDHCINAAQCDCFYKGSTLVHGEVMHENQAICTCLEGRMSCIGAVKEPECVAPMVYFDCANASVNSKGSECQKSCQTYDVDCYSTHCVSGCVCPHGMVLNAKGDCIQEENCPCVHNEIYYQQGENIAVGCNTCTCKDRKWECTEKSCFGTCTIYGNGRHITFDGKRYNFNGDCEFTLAQDYCGNGNNGTFRVITENIPCGTTGTTCSKSMKLFLGGYELILREAHVDVVERDSSIELPYQVRYMGSYMVIESKHGVVLMWDRKTTIFIKLSSDFKGKVCGLCGNFDSNAMNDFTTRSQSVGADVLEFGNSWKASPTCPDASEIKDPCTVKPNRKAWSQKQCSILKSDTFVACHSMHDPTDYYERCVADSCACDAGGDCECFCTAIAAYAQACSDLGVCIHWRMPAICPLFCDYYNKEGDCEWHYKPCGSPCMKTCRNPSGKCLYELQGLEGCYPNCPEDRPYFDEEKMTCTASCGCYDKKGNLFRPEDKVSTEENCKSCTCTMNGFNCNYDLEACFCMYGGKKYKFNEVIYSTGDNSGGCFVATCAANGTIHREIIECPTSPPTTTFTFTTSAPTSSVPIAEPGTSSTPSESTTTDTTTTKDITTGEVTTTSGGTTTATPQTSMQITTVTTKNTPTESTTPITTSDSLVTESTTTTTTETTSHDLKTTTSSGITSVNTETTAPSTTGDETPTTEITTTIATGKLTTSSPNTEPTANSPQTTTADNTVPPTTTRLTPSTSFPPDGSSPTSSTGVTPDCSCTVNGEKFAPGDTVYSKADEEGCLFSAVCSVSCEVEKFMGQCGHPTPPGTSMPSTTDTSTLTTTPRTSSESPSESLPSTTPPSTEVLPTTVHMPEFEIPDGCYDMDPAREVGDTWEINKCANATCAKGGDIVIIHRECPAVKEVTCESGLAPKQVYDQDGCCFQHECESCVGPDGKTRMPGDTWTSNCQKCACDRETITVQCAPMTCEESTLTACDEEGYELVKEVEPDNPCCTKMTCKCNPLLCIPSLKNCDIGFRLSSIIEDDDCCATMTCVPENVCVFNNVTYQPGSNIPQAKRSCKVCNCTEEMNPETQLHDVTCQDIPCKTECAQGYEYKMKNGECCGECVQKACVMKTENGSTTVIEVGQTWYPNENSCSYYECDQIEDQFIPVSVKRACPILDPEDCAEEHIEMSDDGCCKVCRAPQPESCRVQKNSALLAHGECNTTVEMATCEGLCKSFSMFSSKSNAMEPKCTCCQALKTTMKNVNLTCTNGNIIEFSYLYVEECGCMGAICNPRENSEKTEVETKEETEAITESENKSETEVETGSKTELETKSGTESETEVETESGTQAETESETEVGTGVETESGTESETKLESESGTKPETESETKSETELEARSETELGTKSKTEVVTESNTESETKSGTETEVETELGTKAETQVDSGSKTESEAKSGTEVETESETKVEPESETDVGTEAGTESGTESETKLESESGTKAETEVDTGSKTELETKSGSESGTEVETELGTKAEAEVDTGSKTESETKSGIESGTEVETESGTKAETESETEAGTESESESETKLETESETELGTKSGTELETKSETKPETESGTEAETESETEVGTESESESETKLESKSETKSETELGTKSETESETKLETELGTKSKNEEETGSNTESETKTGTESETEEETKSGTKVEAEVETGSKTESETKSGTESGTEVETESGTKAETESETKLESESGTKSETESETKSEAELGTKSESELETKSETKQDTEVENESGTKVETEVEAGSKTKSGTESGTEVETKSGTKSESESETEVGTESESESETELKSKSGTEVETESGTESESESGTKVETESGNKAETEVETGSKIESETKSGPESKTEVETESGSKAETKMEAVSKTKSETKSGTDAGTEVETESESESEAASDIDSETESGTHSETEVEAKSETESGTESETEDYE